MKLLIITFLFPIALLPNLERITQALGAGDANALQEYLDQSVEISLMDDERTYSKAAAVQALRNFFRQYQPRSFSQVHQGTSRNNDSQYCIGDLATAEGTFRVYIYMKVSGTKLIIQELRFDRG